MAAGENLPGLKNGVPKKDEREAGGIIGDGEICEEGGKNVRLC